MARTSADQVGTVIDVDAGDALDAFIDTASAVVDSVCLNSDYDEERLEWIERWLAAHFYDVNRPRNEREGVSPGPSEAHEPIKVDIGLRNTKWGQTALVMDYKGNLAALENRLKRVGVKAGVLYVGGCGHRWWGYGWRW